VPDSNGYPTEGELKVFMKWDIRKMATEEVRTFSPREVVGLIEAIWWYPERQIELREGRERFRRKKVMKLALHTGGWSGNEDIIGKLQETFFWLMYWVESHRGGHYYFEIPWDSWKKKNEH
jgi:hypothetical protein